ncbi:hypothetical protein [Planctomycetes bacterium TBK1r]|uniref:Uncharacterized protein n=1 Tax=Stieleria magnilauensis TaxID=2527963 RepID=A0ABX5XJ28_9BACT|nr:hypothetical protein TBK1r_06570 [Planctomycetes bacterium TBK1r]
MSEQPPSVTAAIGQLFRSIRSKWKGPPDYGEVYRREQVEPTEHLQQIADKFADRGRRLGRRAGWMLAFSLLFIVGGIAVFLVPTEFTDAVAAEREVDEASEVKSGILTQEAEAEVAYLRGRDLYNLYGIFHELDMTLGNYQPGADLAGSPFYGPRIQWARDASRELSASEPTDKRYPFDSFQYHHIEGTTATKVPADVFRLAGQQMRTSGIDLPFLTISLEQLSLAIGGEDEEQAVRTLQRELLALRPLYEDAKREMDRMFVQLDDEAKNRLATTEQLLEAEKRISDALLEVNQTQSDWANQPWVTLLAVRGGVVVLLLYLTTVLLASYRYTQTLSAYYLARADALQLLSHQVDDRLIDAEELQVLLPLLSPDSYRIDQPPAPYESIGQAVAGNR